MQTNEQLAALAQDIRSLPRNPQRDEQMIADLMATMTLDETNEVLAGAARGAIPFILTSRVVDWAIETIIAEVSDQALVGMNTATCGGNLGRIQAEQSRRRFAQLSR